LENVGLAAMPAPKEWTLDQFAQNDVNKLKISKPDVKIQESIPTTLSNMPAHRLVYDIGRRRHNALTLKNLNKPANQGNNNIFFIIIYLAEINKYAIFLPIAQKIINSFEFID
jgi:hypothetical protein